MYPIKMRKEALVPVLRVNPLEERESLRSWGMSQVEIYYEGALSAIKHKGFYLIYLCAPLKAAPERSGWWHIQKALRAASQIMGAEWEGKDVSIWIPHLHALTVFNELIFPEARKAALEFNRRLIQDTKFFDALVVFGDRISEGIRGEIETARTSGLTIISYDEFRTQAENLPSFKESLDYFGDLQKLLNNNQHRFFIP